MINKLMISLSISNEELWTHAVQQEVGFDRIERRDNGMLAAIDIDGKVMSIWVPEVAEVGTPITMENLTSPQTNTIGDIAVIEQSPTNYVSGLEGELNPLVHSN